MRLKSGNDARNFERVEGIAKLNVAQQLGSVTFAAAEVGKSKTVHGVQIAFKGAKGKQVDFQFSGSQERIVSAAGFGSDQKPLRIEARSGGGSAMSYTFSAPPARTEFVVAESFVKREFPFTLTKTSLAAPPGGRPR